MLTLSELAGEAETMRVRVRGKSATMRSLSLKANTMLRATKPRPVAPFAPDPSKGVASPWIVNDNDPDYRRDTMQWHARMRALDVAASLDLEVTNATGSTLRFSVAMAAVDCAAWAELAYDGLASYLTPEQIMELGEQLDKLNGGLWESAKGNS